MNVLSDYVVKITYLDKIGSGFLYFPENNLDKAYIFTARHCILGKRLKSDFDKSNVEIGFFDKETAVISSYHLKKDDLILFGRDNQKEDTAILIINRLNVPNCILEDHSPRLIQITATNARGILVGVPKVTNNEFRRSLHNCRFLTDKDFENQIQITAKNPLLNEFNADNLVEGYSGSGVFISLADKNYVCGIVLEYEPQTKRFLCINFSIANKILGENNIAQLLVMR